MLDTDSSKREGPDVGGDWAIKRRFLIASDYGMGGSWASVLAHSADEILKRYPTVKIVETPPAWLNEEELKRLEETSTVDIDDENHPFFRSIRSENE